MKRLVNSLFSTTRRLLGVFFRYKHTGTPNTRNKNYNTKVTNGLKTQIPEESIAKWLNKNKAN